MVFCDIIFSQPNFISIFWSRPNKQNNPHWTCRMHFIKWNISFLTKDKTQNINYYDDASGWYLPTQILPSNYISTICVAIVLREELIFMKMVVCDNFFVVLHIKSYFNAKHGSYLFLTFLYLTQGRLREAFKNRK